MNDIEKVMDEAHPELKEKNFISKLKPFGGKKQVYTLVHVVIMLPITLRNILFFLNDA